MREIIAALTLAAITPAWGDVAEITDPKSAVDFVLSTCLPAMDNLANVEKMAAENNWFRLPTVVFDSKYTTPHLRWRTNGLVFQRREPSELLHWNSSLQKG